MVNFSQICSMDEKVQKLAEEKLNLPRMTSGFGKKRMGSTLFLIPCEKIPFVDTRGMGSRTPRALFNRLPSLPQELNLAGKGAYLQFPKQTV